MTSTETVGRKLDRLGKAARETNTRLGRIEGRLAGVEQGLTRVGQGVARVEQGVARVEQGVARVEQGVARVEQGVAGVTQGIVRLEKRLGAVEHAIGGVARILDVHTRHFERMEDALVGMSERFDRLAHAIVRSRTEDLGRFEDHERRLRALERKQPPKRPKH
jgi:septal ring factor EnvC (AmiA/AmiB activator)